VDVGLGVVGAIVLLLATPGLAMTAVIALAVLALCLLSIVLQRRRHRRAPRPRHPDRGDRRAAGANRAREGANPSPR
jgi:O-antigen/teichoic acid export membrane protein